MILAVKTTVAVASITLATGLYFSKAGVVSPMISGSVERSNSYVGSMVGGRVASVKVQEGDRVKSGDVLLVLEKNELPHQVVSANAQVAKLKSDIKLLENGYQPHEIAETAAEVAQAQARFGRLQAGARKQEIEIAAAELQSAKDSLSYETRCLSRMTNLLSSKNVSQEEFDEVRVRSDAAQSTYAAASSKLELLRAGSQEQDLLEAEAALVAAKQRHQGRLLGTRPELIEAKKAELRASEAHLAEINSQIEELVVRSPIDGIVENLNVHLGDLAQPNSKLVTVANESDTWIQAYVPAGWKMQVGDTVRCQILGEVETINGHVSFIATDAEFMPESLQTTESRSRQVYAMKIKLSDRTATCRPGTMIDIMPLSHSATALLVAN